jgi:hypothetical protein
LDWGAGDVLHLDEEVISRLYRSAVCWQFWVGSQEYGRWLAQLFGGHCLQRQAGSEYPLER